ncbi:MULTISPECIES: RHS repeat domain-containing protein [Flavobacterium]|uniref:RHS repeat-associated core domain-containing protein n=1 Tax=Flavobacterium columnare TaxID=996 RepID=A0AA94F275_9FLAO|nr:RHS repeat-associated core domain-containing protein [Flavobacterium columnare]
MKYYPFGSLVPNRHGSSTAYRYGFQGQEKDDEIKGEGNSLNYTFRMHDPRVGRFFAVDPLTKSYPFYTPYSFSGNKVIAYIELEGLEEISYFKSQRKKYAGFDLALKLINESGVIQEIKSEFEKNNLGVDIYIIVGDLSDDWGEKKGETIYFKQEGKLLDADTKSTDGTRAGDILTKEQIGEINKKSPNKDTVIAAIDDDNIIAAAKNKDELLAITLTIGHELDLHAKDFKDKKNDKTASEEHSYGYNENLGGYSTKYKDIKKDSPLGRMKDKIEKAANKKDEKSAKKTKK